MEDCRGFFKSIFPGAHVSLILRVALILASFSASALYAQTFGEITGRITDPSGAVVPAATLTLTNVNTNAVRNAQSTQSGDYTFPSVAPGSYQLSTEVSGFRAWSSKPFDVQVQQVVRLDVALQVGNTSEKMEVSADDCSVAIRDCNSRHGHREQDGEGVAAEWSPVPEPGRTFSQCECSRASRRSSGLTLGWRSRPAGDFHRWSANLFMTTTLSMASTTRT